MKKNYYEILEINEKASPEIVEKAYKTLAKKYHPDLQENDFKKEAEEKLKLINEAYEVLSNPEKRKQYDVQLANTRPDTDTLLNENAYLKNELNSLKHFSTYEEQNISQENIINNENRNIEYENELRYRQEVEYAKQKAYHDAYIQDLKNRGYKIRYKKTFKDYVKSFIALLITAFVLALLWQIPFVQNFLLNIYEENSLVKLMVDMISGLFNFS